MKVSYNWLNKYVDLKGVTAQILADTLTLAGLEVESINPIASGTNCVIGQVLSCVDHPESDHLHLTKVDIGSEILEIVCGAPNVAKDQKVIVAQVGAVLPELTIKASTIKGQASQGMICSLLELGVDEKHLNEAQKSGIEVLSQDAPIGLEALSYLGLDDVILDMKPTPNRSDFNALWSVAYEVGALLNRPVHLPWKKDLHQQGKPSSLKVGSTTEKCPLFVGKMIGSVKVGPSPKWMQDALNAVGIKSINNVVDISNYVMVETGQPLHFYDAHKLVHKDIIVKDHQTGALETLDGSKFELNDLDLVITSNNQAIGLAGIMGGEDSKIDELTHSIIIEAAQFNPTSIRHTSRRVNLMTEASLRFQKGLDPQSALKAVDRSVELLCDLAQATDLEATQIYGQANAQEKHVSVRPEHISALIGQTIALDTIVDIYTRLQFKPVLKHDQIDCTIPSYRLDIDVAEDLIEEVGRIVGYAQLPGTLPMMPTTVGGYNPRQLQRQQIRQLCVGFGLHEVITYTLVHEDKTKMGVNPLENPASLISPISEERKAIRNNLLPSVLEAVAYNQAHKMKDFGVFEISNLNTKVQQEERLVIVLSGSQQRSLWQKQSLPFDFYALKGLIEVILEERGFSGHRVRFEANPNHPLFHPLKSATVKIDKEVIGICGEIHPKAAQTFNVSSVYMTELNLEPCLTLKAAKIKFSPIIKYPSVVRDLAFVVDESILASDIEKLIRSVGKSQVMDVTIFDVYQGDKIEIGKKSMALKVVYQAQDHTLTDEEIQSLHQKTVEACRDQLNAQLRA